MCFMCTFTALNQQFEQMANQRIDAKCRMEEVPVLGDMALTSAERDQQHIVTLVPDYTPAFFAALRAKQEAIENLVQPGKMTAERKAVTTRLYANLDEVKDKLTLLEIQISRARGLTVDAGSFNLAEIRNCIRTRNAEGTLQAMRYTLALIDDNVDALKLKGFTDAQKDYFGTKLSQIKDDNTLQSAKLSDRRSLTQDNIAMINAYWAEIMEVMNTCKLVYKGNPAKTKDYTFRSLRQQVRADGKKATPATGTDAPETTGSITATAINKTTGDPLEGVTMLILDTDISDVTDSEGDAYLDEVAAGEYTLSFSKPGFAQVLFNHTQVLPGGDTELEAELEPET